MTIENATDLRLEILRLKALKDQQESALADDLKGIKDGLKPVNLLVNTVSSLFARKEHPGALSGSFYYGIGFVIEKILLRKSSGMGKYLLAYLLQNLAANVADEKSDVIKDTLRTYLVKLKDKLPFSKKNRSTKMGIENDEEV